MKLFKKIDNYLLHHYPSLWVTRIHIFLPIGIGLVLLLFFGNMAIGWNPKDNFPEAEINIIFTIIPVLVYLVYWFIFQSRYNVSKSGGKMTIGEEYVNFFSYMVVFFVAFMFILAIPYSNYQKIVFAVDEDELSMDIEALNEGNCFVNQTGYLDYLGNGRYEYQKENFVYDYSYNYSYDEDYYERKIISRKEVYRIIERYVSAYNKYTHYPISKDPQLILEDRMSDDYYYYEYGDDSWLMSWKLERIQRYHEQNGWLSNNMDEWFWKISLALIAWLALVVWIFKQMKLRQFIYGFISILLTPLAIVLVGVLVFEVLYLRSHDGEDVALYLVLIGYAVAAFIVRKGFVKDSLSNTSYIVLMYLHFFLPILPIWIFILIGKDNYYGHYYHSEEFFIGVIYWACVIVGLLSIVFLKPVYEKFRAMPSRK